MKETAIPKKNKNVVCRVIGTETVLLPIYKNTDEMNCIYTLNKPAAWVWERIDGKNSVGQIKKLAQKDFDGAESQISSELDKLLSELSGIKAITQI